jgi:ribose transport system substrate-binding protein
VVWSRWGAAVAAIAAVAFAGCGNSSSGGSSTSSATSKSAASTASQTPNVPTPPTTPTSNIGVTEPLAKKPPAKSVVWLQCELPICARYGQGFKSATSALGWKLKTMVYKATAPGAALAQAVAQRPDYIAISGIPSSVLKPQLAAAKAAGIPVFGGGSGEKPPNTPFALMTGGTLQPDAEHVANWMIKDSKGAAHAVAVSITQYPSLNSETDWLKANFTKRCSGCSYDLLPITVDDVGAGAVPQKITAYLQAHPKTNYVFLTFSDLATGVPQALKNAGLADKVKIVGVAGGASNFKDVQAGKQSAWTTAGVEWDSWVMVDGMARLANGQKIPQQEINAVYPRPEWVVTNSPQAKQAIDGAGGEWNGPVDFQQKFKQLWQVG